MSGNMSKWSILMILTVLLLSWTTVAAALETRSGDMVNVPAGDLKGPLFVSGNNLIVNANVEGDVFAVGSSVTINGNVNGDVIAAANSVAINGMVSGDIRTAGNTIDVGSTVGGSVTSAGNTVTLRESSQVARDVMAFGNSADLRGTVQGQVMGSSNQFSLQGPVGGDVKLWDVQNLIVGPTAAVQGSINYGSANPAQVDPSAQVGAIAQLAPPVRLDAKVPEVVTHGMAWTGTIIMVIAGFLVWGLFYLVFPQLFPRGGHGEYGPFLAKLGWGFLALLVVPMAVVMLFITVVGIPLAMILLFLYILFLYLAKILVADYLVRVLAEKYNWQGKGPVIAGFLVLFVMLSLTSRIPMGGFVLGLLIAAVAFGVLITAVARRRQAAATA